MGAHAEVFTHPEPHLISPIAHLGVFGNVDKAPYDHINAAEATRAFIDDLPRGEEDYLDALRGPVEAFRMGDPLSPDTRIFCKRVCADTGYFDTFNRDNVHLVDVSDSKGVERITAKGVVAGGQEYEVDCIIYATGFKTDKFMWPMEICGREGQLLAEKWALEPSAYLGITVSGFPNFYCMFGPGTNLAFGGSLIFCLFLSSGFFSVRNAGSARGG